MPFFIFLLSCLRHAGHAPHCFLVRPVSFTLQEAGEGTDDGHGLTVHSSLPVLAAAQQVHEGMGSQLRSHPPPTPPLNLTRSYDSHLWDILLKLLKLLAPTYPAVQIPLYASYERAFDRHVASPYNINGMVETCCSPGASLGSPQRSFQRGTF